MRTGLRRDGGAAARPAAAPAATRSRTPAAWARPRRRSSAGIALARGLVAGGRLLLDDEQRSRLAADVEGHPDNVAPAWYGGFVISRPRGRPVATPSRAAVDPRVSAVVFVPPTPVATEVARGLLPATVPHADAAANAGRAALLVAALAGRPEHCCSPPATCSTRTTGARPCRQSLTWSTRCAPTGRRRRLRRRADRAGVHRRPGAAGRGLGDRPRELLARCPAGWSAHHLDGRHPRRRGLG